MAKMVTKNMSWNKVLWTCFDRDGHKYFDEYTGCADVSDTLKALAFWYEVNEAEEDIKDYRPCFVDIQTREGVRGMDISDFIRLGNLIPEDGSRKGLVTRTVTIYTWKVYRFDENDNPVSTRVYVNEEMTKKQVLKTYGGDMAKLIESSDMLIGMDTEVFFQNSITVER